MPEFKGKISDIGIFCELTGNVVKLRLRNNSGQKTAMNSKKAQIIKGAKRHRGSVKQEQESKGIFSEMTIVIEFPTEKKVMKFLEMKF